MDVMNKDEFQELLFKQGHDWVATIVCIGWGLMDFTNKDEFQELLFKQEHDWKATIVCLGWGLPVTALFI